MILMQLQKIIQQFFFQVLRCHNLLMIFQHFLHVEWKSQSTKDELLHPTIHPITPTTLCVVG